jgi:hypothetical protein
LLGTAACALAAHIGWSAMVVGLMDHFYGHRILNLRKAKAPVDDWEKMSAAFFQSVMAKAAQQQKPSAVFLGSSVTYGYPWQEPVIFSRAVADQLPQWQVANLSMVGVGFSGILDFTSCALGGRIRPDVLIVEIPLVNSIIELKPGQATSMRQCSSSAQEPVSYWELVLARPYGLGWLTLLWDEEAYHKPDSDIQIYKLPTDYFSTEERFARIQSQFARELRAYVHTMSEAADRVIFFVSPVYTAGIGEAGGDGAAVERQIQFAYAVCRENPRVSCIDPASLVLGREMFYNLTHLNQRGHRALGEYFAREIVSR